MGLLGRRVASAIADDRHEDVDQHIQGELGSPSDVFGQRNTPVEVQDDERADDQRDGEQPYGPHERSGRCVLETVHHEPILIRSGRHRKWVSITVRGGARSLPRVLSGPRRDEQVRHAARDRPQRGTAHQVQRQVRAHVHPAEHHHRGQGDRRDRPAFRQMHRHHHGEGGGHRRVPRREPEALGAEPFARLDPLEEPSGASAFDGLFHDQGQQVDARAGQQQRPSQAEPPERERDQRQDRDRDERAVLHERPHERVVALREFVDRLEDRDLDVGEFVPSEQGAPHQHQGADRDRDQVRPRVRVRVAHPVTAFGRRLARGGRVLPARSSLPS